MSFQPTFAQAFYRPCVAGNVYLANLALLGEPLTARRLKIIQPLIQTAGRLLDDSFQQFWQRAEDSFTSSPQNSQASYYQYKFGLVLAQTAPEMLIGLTSSLKRRSAVPDMPEEIGSVLSRHWAFRQTDGKRGKDPVVADDVLLWSLARNAGNIEAAARELGYPQNTLYARLRRRFVAHDAYVTLQRIHRINGQSVTGFREAAKRHPEYKVLDESDLITQATLAIIMGSQLMAQAGIFSEAMGRQVMEDARELSCDNCATISPTDHHFGYTFGYLPNIIRLLVHENASPDLVSGRPRHYVLGRAPRFSSNPLTSIPSFYNPVISVPLILKVETA